MSQPVSCRLTQCLGFFAEALSNHSVIGQIKTLLDNTSQLPRGHTP